MNAENDHDYFNCTLKHETEKAYIVTLKSSGKDFSVPKSLCDLKLFFSKVERTPGFIAPDVLEVESWFAHKEGMHDE